MAMLFGGEASRQAAWQQMGLSLDETVDMLLVLRDREAERGDQAEADMYARLAGEFWKFLNEKKGQNLPKAASIAGAGGILETLR